MNTQLNHNINSGADFANTLQFLNETDRRALYDQIKDRLPDFIHSSSDFANILQYLSKPERTDMFEKIKPILLNFIRSDNDRRFTLRYLAAEEASSLNNLLTFIDRMKASEPVVQFASALLENDLKKMKFLFEALLHQCTQSTKQSLSFFKEENRVAQMINASAHLSPQWLNKLNDALGLALPEESQSSPKAVIDALKAYTPSSGPGVVR